MRVVVNNAELATKAAIESRNVNISIACMVVNWLAVPSFAYGLKFATPAISYFTGGLMLNALGSSINFCGPEKKTGPAVSGAASLGLNVMAGLMLLAYPNDTNAALGLFIASALKCAIDVGYSVRKCCAPSVVPAPTVNAH